MAVIAGYNAAIALEGGSMMNFGSGASLQFAAGGALVGTFGGTPTFAERITLTKGETTSVGGATCVASSGLRLASDIAASSTTLGVFEVADFGNGVKIFLGRTQDAPSANGSPGSLIIRLPSTGTPSSVVGWYIKAGDNSPGSGNWVSLQTSASAG